VSVSTITKQLIEGVDPTELITTRNVRLAEVDEEFVSSIREHGVLQPVIAAPYEEGMAVLFGNRRTAGAIAAGTTVDVVLRHDLTGEAARIIAQLVENMHRQDMRPTEIAAAYVQLALDLGMSDDEIAKQVSRDREGVRAAIALHNMPKAARDAVDAHTLDLEVVLQLQEFEADPKVYKRLMDAIEKGQNIKYAFVDERRKKELKEKRARIVAELKDAGVVVIPKPKELGYGAKELRLESLTDAGGRKLTVKQHASCPGHVACLDGTYTPEAAYLCRDPKAYGHIPTGYYKYKSAEEEAEEQVEQHRKAEEQEALTVAAEVRQEFVAGICQSQRVPKGAMRYALETLFAYGVPETRTRQALVLAFLGAREPGEDPTAAFGKKLTRIAEARKPLVLLAHAAALMENNMASVRHSYQFKPDLSIAWLEFLSGHGYRLTAPETMLLEGLRERAAAQDSADGEKDENDDYEDEDEEEDGDESPADSQESADRTTDTAEPDETDGESEDHEACNESELPAEAAEAQDDQSDAGQWEAVYPELNEPMMVAA
jgi:ParB/RepB/Spo0J family partition protein